MSLFELCRVRIKQLDVNLGAGAGKFAKLRCLQTSKYLRHVYMKTQRELNLWQILYKIIKRPVANHCYVGGVRNICDLSQWTVPRAREECFTCHMRNTWDGDHCSRFSALAARRCKSVAYPSHSIKIMVQPHEPYSSTVSWIFSSLPFWNQRMV
jgi:hypothetical protein